MSDALYRSRAAVYVARAEQNAMNALYERPAMQALVGSVAGQRVLDAGCAGGGHSEWLAAQGCRVVGVDKSPEMVNLYRKRLGHVATAHQAESQHAAYPQASQDSQPSQNRRGSWQFGQSTLKLSSWEDGPLASAGTDASGSAAPPWRTNRAALPLPLPFPLPLPLRRPVGANTG